MSRIRAEFDPSNRDKVDFASSEQKDSLEKMMTIKLSEFRTAVNAGDPVKAEKVRMEFKTMLDEMHMINPELKTSVQEEFTKMESEYLNTLLHGKSYKRHDGEILH
jgi:hypothetical protein